MAKFVRYIGGKRVKGKPKRQDDGSIIVMLDNGRGVRGTVRRFKDGKSYEEAVEKIPVTDKNPGT